MKLIQSFVIAISMYSRIPMPNVGWDRENMKSAMCFFPAVGVIIGFCEYLAGRLMFCCGCGSVMRGAGLTVLPVLISGGIHLDGFMDTVDALASGKDRQRKLEILADSRVGAFAVLGLGCYLLWNAAVWSEVTLETLGTASCVFTVSRAMSGFIVATVPAAKESGLFRMFQDGAAKVRVRVATAACFLISAAVMIWMNAGCAAGALIAAVLTFLYATALGRRQFGGFTGDLAGYFLQLAELMMLTGAIAGGVIWN